MFNLSFLPLSLFLICCYGVFEHYRAYSVSLADIEAMVAVKRNGYLLKGVRGDLQEELYRMGAKFCLALVYLITALSPGSLLAKMDFTSLILFLLQLVVLLFLSASTHIRRETRRNLIREALAERSRQAITGDSHGFKLQEN